VTRAVAPKVRPDLPEGATGWARSTRRAGGVFHAHALGRTACGRLRLYKHHCDEASSLAEMQYWGVCPRCLAKAKQ